MIDEGKDFLNYFELQSFKFCAASQILLSAKSQRNLKIRVKVPIWLINAKIQLQKLVLF